LECICKSELQFQIHQRNKQISELNIGLQNENNRIKEAEYLLHEEGRRRQMMDEKFKEMENNITNLKMQNQDWKLNYEKLNISFMTKLFFLFFLKYQPSFNKHVNLSSSRLDQFSRISIHQT